MDFTRGDGSCMLRACSICGLTYRWPKELRPADDGTTRCDECWDGGFTMATYARVAGKVSPEKPPPHTSAPIPIIDSVE